jgi:hypothetical protein
LRAGGKIFDKRQKSDRLGIKKNHRERKVFEKMDYGRCVLNHGQENLAQKKTHPTRTEKYEEFLARRGNCSRARPSKIVDPCSHSPSTEVEQNSKNDTVACRKAKNSAPWRQRKLVATA